MKILFSKNQYIRYELKILNVLFEYNCDIYYDDGLCVVHVINMSYNY